MTNIDPNAIAANIATDLIKTSFNNAIKGASTAMRSAWDKVFEDFSPYMETTRRRNRFVRILCQKDSDVDIYSLYVESRFQCGNDVHDDSEIIRNVIERSNIVITGNGGAGKTIFMRHLWLHLFEHSSELTPIFVELRHLNELTSIDIKSYVRRTISTKREMSEELFEFFCENGRFCFLLDGFDEVAQSQREALQAQILRMASTYPRCPIVVSSRFDKRFSGWNEFSVYQSTPLALDQVRHLITRVPFDQSAKALFLKRLDDAFYEQNESFLSNPLLAIMMMMTFRENMDIPKKMSIFYDQAFNTLYQWHDATKAYSRRKTLDIEEFQRSFGAFCLLSYYQQSHEFSASEMTDYISKSSKVCGYKYNTADILNDYEESVNLIRQDGLSFVFIHRSFQEYFAAYAMVNILSDKFSQFLPSITKRLSDNVLALCYQMNPRLVVIEYVDPEYMKLKSNRFFPPKPQRKLGYLETINARYTLYVRRHHSHDNDVVNSLRAEINEDLSLFVENVRRLKDDHIHVVLSHIQRQLMSTRLFSIFRHARIPNDYVDASFYVSIWFQDSKIEFKLYDVKDEEIFDTSLSEIVGAALKRHVRVFEEIEHQVLDSVSKIDAWSTSQIRDVKRIGKSIDDILGI
ncbi:MAG: NACHT domain-containing protein [Aliihoeflea sp.]